jgi:hypothetical protein
MVEAIKVRARDQAAVRHEAGGTGSPHLWWELILSSLKIE